MIEKAITKTTKVQGLRSDPVGHRYKPGDVVVTPDGFRFFLGTSAEHFFCTKPVPHDQAITDEDARRVGIDLDAEGYVKPGQVVRREGATEPDTTERVEATSITINLAKGMATDVALMHVISRAAVMLGAGPRDWDAMAAWLRERELPK